MTSMYVDSEVSDSMYLENKTAYNSDVVKWLKYIDILNS